jgi:hypothetical protein
MTIKTSLDKKEIYAHPKRYLGQQYIYTNKIDFEILWTQCTVSLTKMTV